MATLVQVGLNYERWCYCLLSSHSLYFLLLCVFECSCDSSIACYDLQQIPPLNAGSVSEFTELIFRDGNITSIPNNSLPPGLTSIELNHLALVKIAEDAFDSSAETLGTVIIKETQFTSLPTALKKLTKLTVLFIHDTPIQVWDTATLKQIGATVENLQLKNVTLSAWPSWISDFVSLQSLDLSWNPLKDIPVDAFSSFKDSVRYLYLRGVGLTDVPQALSTLSSLTYLDLGNNNFTGVSVFKQITESPFAEKLSALYLDSSGLTGVATFTNLTNIRVISLSNNRISDVPAGSLSTSLTSLDLSKNILVSVPKDVAIMTSLSYLDLSNNQLTNMQPKSLNGNPISVISADAFSNLTRLRHLEIKNSQLTEFPLAFSQLPRQTYIYFSAPNAFSCPCPAPQQLVQWFMSVRNRWRVEGMCTDGRDIELYLSGQCEQT
ncbi:unnamed protein product [Candidula unifasciata]|uniref:Uncharacterized protein n=1 Tax=Candidula unifasciata TaxID=100452 RepID=A0A8S3YZG3_9EUPU|nr:unnamed protein product [Candidula unifasciata]